jgi:hypothetical protein
VSHATPQVLFVQVDWAWAMLVVHPPSHPPQ